MRNEPEWEVRFQCEASLKREMDSQRGMSLKGKCRMLRMNDNPLEEFGAAGLSRDAGICDDQPPRGLVSSGGRSGLRGKCRDWRCKPAGKCQDWGMQTRRAAMVDELS